MGQCGHCRIGQESEFFDNSYTSRPIPFGRGGIGLGVLPLHLPYSSKSILRRGFGTTLRLVSAASSLVLLAHIPASSLASPLTPILLILRGCRWNLRRMDVVARTTSWSVVHSGSSGLRRWRLGRAAWKSNRGSQLGDGLGPDRQCIVFLRPRTAKCA